MNDLIRRLAALDTCAVSDALDAAGIPGATTGVHAVSGNRRIAGAVITVDLVSADLVPAGSADAAPDARPRHLGTAAVDAAGPGTVIVVAHHGRTKVAGWGGVLSAGARQRGVEAVIVDGAVRDLDEARSFGLDLYARTSVPVTARGRIVERGWNVPVTVEGIDIAPGDLVIADASGVVFIPAGRAAEIIGAAERIVAKEAKMLRRVRAGESMASVMGADYESMLESSVRP